MSTRMRWDKRRPQYRPWYDRDLNPFEREATNLARHGVPPSPKQAKPAKPKLPPIRTPERPAVAAGALARKYAIRTGDLAKARESLSGAMEVTIYCDGGCAPRNPGPMGWGIVVLAEGIRVELYGGAGTLGTNNRAEIEAATLALEAIPRECRATLISDSTYLVDGASKWCSAWRQRDFKRNGVDIPNADRWRKLDNLAAGRPINWRWQRGHCGDPGNELADKLAALGRTGGRA